MDSDGRDPFVSMMTAESKVTLNLSDFAPQSMLRVAEHSIERPKFPAIDFHNHIDGLEPSEVLRVMDACGIEQPGKHHDETRYRGSREPRAAPRGVAEPLFYDRMDGLARSR